MILSLGLMQRAKHALAHIESFAFLLRKRSWDYGRQNVSINPEGTWFQVDESIAVLLKDESAKIVTHADLVMKHQFNILGTGLRDWGDTINWDLDIKSGRKWAPHYYKRLVHKSFTGTGGSDVKVPWELSTFHHLLVLIQAYIVTGDRRYADECFQQIRDWIVKNPVCYGVNWTCAIEVALRVCNWIWGWWALRTHSGWSEDFNQMFSRSVWEHGWYIENNLENKHNRRTNHYLANIVGLLFIGLMYPEFKEANRWRLFGVKELVRCMDEMVYPDGVSFENSTSYHRLALEFFIFSSVLCRNNGINLPDRYWIRLEKMIEFIYHCTRPDGRMPMLGDAGDDRFFIFKDYYGWDRWDFRYLLCIGAALFKRKDFKEAAEKFYIEVAWLFGRKGKEIWDAL